VSASLVQRLRRSKAPPIYVRRERIARRVGTKFVIALLVLIVVTVAVFVALNSKYILLGAEALAIGLIIAFAWLDAELRDPRPPSPPT
jgi:cytochrome c-type biogenesis protein CcmH/NrfG